MFGDGSGVGSSKQGIQANLNKTIIQLFLLLARVRLIDRSPKWEYMENMLEILLFYGDSH